MNFVNNVVRSFVIALLAGLFSAGYVAGQGTAEIEQTAERVRVLADSAGAPGGAVVMVVGGRVVLAETFGFADAGGRLVDMDTPFRVASVSKVFTAAAVARLVAEGVLSLHADLRDGRDWLRAIAPGPEPVTLVQLLTHTSGFDDRVVGMFAREASDVLPLEEYLVDRMPPRTTDPARWTRYSNHGAALVGLVLEEATGEPFADVVSRLVLEPADMSASSFQQPLPAKLRERMARVYPCDGGTCDPIPLDYRNTPPAGALVTTPADMGRFLETLVATEDVLGAGTRDTLFTRQWGHRPELPGLALALQEQPIAGRRGLVHAGGSSGYSSLLAVVPEVAAGLFVVTTGGSFRLGGGVLRTFEELLRTTIAADASSRPSVPSHAGSFLEPIGNPEPLTDREIGEYAGSYRLARAPRTSYEQFPALFLFTQEVGFDEDGFLVRREGGLIRRYGRVEGDLFGSTDGLGRLAFERDETGRVVAMHAADEAFGARFPGSFERVQRWAAPGFMNELLSWLVGLPVLALMAWGLASLGRVVAPRWSRGLDSDAQTRLLRPAGVLAGVWTSVVLMGLMLLFTFGFMARFNAAAARAPEMLAYGLPEQLTRLLWVPWAILSATVGLVAVTVWSWRRREGRIEDRLLFVTVTSCAAVFLALMSHFDLLPPVG